MQQKTAPPPPGTVPSTTQPIYEDIDAVPLTLLEQMSAHWRVLYETKRRLHEVSARQIIAGQLFTIVAVASAAILLDNNKEALLLAGSTLVLYPALSSLLSSNATVLAASLHHEIDETTDRVRLVLGATVRSVAVASMASVLIGIFAGLVGLFALDTAFWTTVKLASLAGIISGALGLPLSVVLTLLIRRLKANPDDMTAPLENTIFSVLTLVAIVLVTRSGL
jgi:cation transporter-like permease